MVLNQLFSQSAQDTYGKNRIQYQNFNWSVISTDNFDIYYYPQSKKAALLAAKYAEFEFDRITDLMGYAPYSRIKLIIYATHSDLIQSNIGLSSQQVFIGAYTVFTKNRVEVAFNGIQSDFQREIGKGVSTMIINEMMYSGNFKDILQSTFALSIPEWYLSGLVAFLNEGWSVERDDQIRDLFSSKRIRKPNRFIGQDAAIVGHSFWNYVSEKYGKGNISNILNETKYFRNHEKAFSSVLNIKYKTLVKEWREYYQKQTQFALDTFQMPGKEKRIIKNTSDNAIYSSIRISPDGSRLAFVQNTGGRYKVIVKNLKTGRKYVVYRGGYVSYDQKVDFQMPVVAWRGNNKVGVVSVKHDKMKLVTYDIRQQIENGKERLKLEISNFFDIHYSLKQTYRGIYKHFKQVNDFDFNDDGSYIVISGENNLGQSDVFIYNLRNNNITQITNDVYDDMHPVFMPNTIKSFVFNSNRPMDTLMPKQNQDYRKLKYTHDIFLYNQDSSKTIAKRLTNSPFNEINPRINKDGNIYFLSDRNGINSLYKLNSKTNKTSAVSNYGQNFQSYDINYKQSSLAYIMNDDGKSRIFLDTTFKDHTSYDSLVPTSRQEIFNQITKITNSTSSAVPTITYKTPVVTRFELMNSKKKSAMLLDTNEIDTDKYVFEFEKKKKPANDPELVINGGRDSTGKIVPKKPKIIELKLKYNEIYISSPQRFKYDFAIDNLTTSLRIDPLRGTGILGGVNMSDMMGNHRINGGIFGAFDFKTSIMWGEYEYLKKRTDFKIRLTKDVLYWNQNILIHRYSMYKYEFTASYPLNPAMRFSATPFYANTRYTNMLVLPNFVDKTTDYMGFTLDYTYDNSRSLGINMNLGTKVKIGFSNYFGLGQSDKSFGKLFVDARNYTRVHKDLIFASRFSAGAFLGANKKYFLIGGMDNWLFNNTDQADDNHPLNTSPNIDNSNLLFIDYVTNLRGFNYSAQYGHNYFLYNGELRLPIIKYLVRRQITSNFLRNFQVVGFYDFGVAWSGKSPFTLENDINNQIIDIGSFKANVTNYRNPFIYGYGFGFRSMIWGYYAKLDFAWGVQDYVRQNLKVYLSIGYDF